MKDVGRNEPCPCGSGKKYKNCCLDKQKADLKNSNDMSEIPEDLHNTATMVMNEMGYESTKSFIKDFTAYKDFMESQHEESFGQVSFREFMGGVSPTKDFNELLYEEANATGVETSDEVEKLAKEVQLKYNATPQESLLGLSPDQMDVILTNYKDFEDMRCAVEPFVVIDQNNIDALSIESAFLDMFIYVLREYAQHGGKIKITKTGNFNLAFINKLRKELFEETEDEIQSLKIYEYNIELLSIVHWFLRIMDFVDENTSSSSLTDYFFSFAYISLDDMHRSMWFSIFGIVISKLNWAPLFHYKHPQIDRFIFFLQHVVLFSFRILHHLDERANHGNINRKDVFELLKKEYPHMIPELEDLPFIDAEQVFNTVFINKVCLYLGLIDLPVLDDSSSAKEYILCTDLFRKIINWKV